MFQRVTLFATTAACIVYSKKIGPVCVHQNQPSILKLSCSIGTIVKITNVVYGLQKGGSSTCEEVYDGPACVASNTIATDLIQTTCGGEKECIYVTNFLTDDIEDPCPEASDEKKALTITYECVSSLPTPTPIPTPATSDASVDKSEVEKDTESSTSSSSLDSPVIYALASAGALVSFFVNRG